MLIYFLVQVSCTRTSPAVNRRRSSKSGDTPHRRTRRIHVRRAISYRNPENGSFNLVSGNFIFEIWKDMERYEVQQQQNHPYPITGDMSRGSRALLGAFEVFAGPVALELARRLARIFAATE